MSCRVIQCRKGDPCSFSVTVEGGFSAAYTLAKFAARDEWDETSPALIAIDQTSGITFDQPNSVIYVNIGATHTDALPVLRKPREVAAQLRLYNGIDADDRMSFPIPFQILPDVIVDGA